jgi:type IV fimbrial biogenesis protein FimT
MQSSPKRRNRGLTLIELLITLVIAAIVLTLGSAGLGELIARNRMVTAVNTFIANLQLARSEAVTRGGDVVLCPSTDGAGCTDSTDWHSGYLVFSDEITENSAVDEGEPVIRVVQGDADAPVEITSTAGRTSISYQGDGTSAGANVTLTFCDTSGRTDDRQVVISNVGRPRTQDAPAGSCGG